MEQLNLEHHKLQSDDIGDLTAALAKAQSKMANATKGSDNPFFKSKYADLTEVIRVSRNELTENGIAVTQMATIVDGKPVLVCQLSHTSGQWIRGFFPLNPVKNDPQGMGSAITYMRRYSLAAMVGIGQEDDDANSISEIGQSGNTPARKTPPAARAKRRSASKKPEAPTPPPSNEPVKAEEKESAEDAARKQDVIEYLQRESSKPEVSRIIQQAVNDYREQNNAEGDVRVSEFPLNYLEQIYDKVTRVAT